MSEVLVPLHLGIFALDVGLSAFAVYLLKTKAPLTDDLSIELLAGTVVGGVANALLLSDGSFNLWLWHAIAGAFVGTFFYGLFIQVIADLIIWWWTHNPS